MKNKFFTILLATGTLTGLLTKLVAVDTIPTLNMYGDIKNVTENRGNSNEPTKKYMYEPDPAQVAVRSSNTGSSSNVQDNIQKVQSMYSTLSAEEKQNFNMAYKQLQETCKTIISKHEISFSRSSNPTSYDLGPVQLKK